MVVVFGDVAHCLLLERDMEIKLEDKRYFTIGLTIYFGCNAVCVNVCARAY
jgi:hypothetical protein